MSRGRRGVVALLFVSATLAALAGGLARTPVRVQADGRTPLPWHVLDTDAQARFDLGHAVFNTSWLPAGEGGGRRDGLGPLFNAPSCDACHNSRRRGRGPHADGPAPSDFVVQVARRTADGIERAHPRFGHLVNTDAIAGFAPEAAVTLAWRTTERTRADGTLQRLHRPEVQVTLPDGAPLPGDLVLQPRVASQVLGSGLLEQVDDADILAGTRARRGRPQGVASWVETDDGRRLGRFGWQATEPDIAAQTANAFAREMGLTSTRITAADCGAHDTRCRTAPQGGTPEVDPALFDALVASSSRRPCGARPMPHTISTRIPAARGCSHARAAPTATGHRCACATAAASRLTPTCCCTTSATRSPTTTCTAHRCRAAGARRRCGA